MTDYTDDGFFEINRNSFIYITNFAILGVTLIAVGCLLYKIHFLGESISIE